MHPRCACLAQSKQARRHPSERQTFPTVLHRSFAMRTAGRGLVRRDGEAIDLNGGKIGDAAVRDGDALWRPCGA